MAMYPIHYHGQVINHSGTLLSPVAARGGYSSLQRMGFSLRWLFLLRNAGSRRAGFSSCGTWAQELWHVGSVVVAHGFSSCGLQALEHRLSSCGAQA